MLEIPLAVVQTQVFGVGAQHFVVDRGDADQTRQPAAFGLAHTQQTDHIGGVRVIGQVEIGFVDARGLFAGIAHMHDQTQQFATRVLAYRLAHVQADAVIDDVDVFIRIALHRQAAQHDKTTAVFQLLGVLKQLAFECFWQRKISRYKVWETQSLLLDMGQGAIQCGNFIGGPVPYPAGIARKVSAAPCSRASQCPVFNDAHE